MTIQQCDKCGTEVDWDNKFSVGAFSASADLCIVCFQPYLRKLKREKLMPEKLVRRIKIKKH